MPDTHCVSQRGSRCITGAFVLDPSAAAVGSSCLVGRRPQRGHGWVASDPTLGVGTCTSVCKSLTLSTRLRAPTLELLRSMASQLRAGAVDAPPQMPAAAALPASQILAEPLPYGSIGFRPLLQPGDTRISFRCGLFWFNCAYAWPALIGQSDICKWSFWNSCSQNRLGLKAPAHFYFATAELSATTPSSE